MQQEETPVFEVERRSKSYSVFDTFLVIVIAYGISLAFDMKNLHAFVSDKQQSEENPQVSVWLAHASDALKRFGFESPKSYLRSSFYNVASLKDPIEELGFVHDESMETVREQEMGEPTDAVQIALKAKYVIAMGLDIAPQRLIALDTVPPPQTISAPQPLNPLKKELTPIGEKQLLIVGDSIMGGIAPQIKRELRSLGTKTEPVIEWKISTGLGRPDYYNWPSVTKALLDKNQIDYAIALFGTNDVKALKHDGKFIAFDTVAWHTVYNQRVIEMQELLCSKAKKVYWLALPPMRKEDLHAGAAKLNEIYADQAKGRSCVEFVSLDPLVADDQGNFITTKYLADERVELRAKDGIHLSSKAGNLVARHILELIASEQNKEPLHGQDNNQPPKQNPPVKESSVKLMAH